MSSSKFKLSYPQAIKFLISLLDQYKISEFDFKKNTITVFNEHDQKEFQYNYPFILNLTQDIIKDENLLNNYIHRKPLFIMMLIQAGNAALAQYDGDKLLHHKVVRKYMTRKKQGKSQLKYLKTKGKSRAGSRIRLANSVLFFQEINQYLNDWSPSDNTTIIYSCTPMLWGMLFQSKVVPPFKKKDLRLKKLPLSIDVPNFEVLKNAVHFTQKGNIQLFPGCSDTIRDWIFHTLASIKSIQ